MKIVQNNENQHIDIKGDTMSKIIEKERIYLKEVKGINEAAIQEYINNDPKVLGLGDLEVIKKELLQQSGGRLDFLLQNEDEDTRYEVEIQLGQTDASHIMRTIEYWDNEKKRTPDKNHVAVLVAENITDRFQNVISLFNKAIPMIAIQMVAFKESEGNISLAFIKIMDLANIDQEEDIDKATTDRTYWEKKSSKTVLELVDKIYEELLSDIKNIKLNYNKFYIGLNINNVSDNIMSFVPKKRFLKIRIKMDENNEVEEYFDEKGFDISYCSKLGRKDYTIKVNTYDEYIKIKPKLVELLDNLKKEHCID